MIKMGQGSYSFKLFSLHPSLVNIITTREAGNFLPLKSGDKRPLLNFERLGVDYSKIVMAQQVHSANLALVKDISAGQTIEGVDALFTTQTNLYLLIIVADCVPLLFYDPIKGFVACAHSGWQSALQKISLRILKEFIKRGSSKENILVAFGPSIGSEHYDVSEGRVRLFDTAFGKSIVTKRKKGRTYLNLVEATKQPITSFGIPEKNIEISNVCTAENTNEFYSYRGEQGSKGRFAAIIGLKS